jgi:hypothetical protein
MLRFKYLLAICSLALTLGQADAATFSYTGIFDPGTVNARCGSSGPCSDFPYNNSIVPGGSLSGTAEITDGIVSAINLSVSGLRFAYDFTTVQNNGVNFCSGCASATSGSEGGLALSHIDFFFDAILRITPSANGLTTLSYVAGFDNPFDQQGVGQWKGSGTFTVVTPLPAALPLLAGGIGVLGLFGWRRQRNAAALAA